MSFRDLDLASIYSAAEDRLHRFYVPLLQGAVAYDRVTGYFRSSSLSAAAAGLSHFIARGGTMRLIAGAEFSDEDLTAITEGTALADVLARRLLADPLEGADIVSEHRLETLAWLVREGRLQIKIGVPLDPLGRPLRREQTDRYFHSKYGVFTDAEANRVAFSGSMNESGSGLSANHETFNVFPSWLPEVWAWSGLPIVDRFEAHWRDRPEAGWKVLPLPEAVAERLVARVRDRTTPPRAIDPAEVTPSRDADRETALLAFVALAPRLGGGTGVGFATAGVEPWPHQLAIAKRAVSTYPRSYLLADEVGLGKTIEAGLILRELQASGRAATALILVPASVLGQWQEELEEKFSLRIPRYDGTRFLMRDDEEIESPPGNPWSAFPVLLASSHLARRRSRRTEILSARPWDVVLVDEAHHARRSGTKANATPNTLLALLRAMRAQRQWRALYLASATPMQMHAHEAWDLLELLGLTGRWAESADQFVRYYTELRESFPERDWRFLQLMSSDQFLDPIVQPDPILEAKVRQELGLAGSNLIRMFPQNGLTTEVARELPGETRDWMDEWLRANTPMRDRVFRTTRTVLRRYKDEGLLRPGSVIPHRQVRDRFVPLTTPERQLYDRIETYISQYYDAYQKGPQHLKPLGFIMTVYRRRLTSSFLAIERSLQRRREVLLGNAFASGLLDPDDLAALENSALFDAFELPEKKQKLVEEAQELGEFLEELGRRPPDESKMAYLHQELDDAFREGHNTAIVFTQYTDTMDYVRAQLLPWYGAKVVCYSGRGGQRWSDAARAWLPLTKTEVKNLFREGKEVKILLGTDSLSEGLNLQTCGKLINYDMPWNFMRVEQRIGRVDRINGQPNVEISNYFCQGTVEEQLYRGISEDFDWFTDIVGPAQSVLGSVESILEDLAMQAPGQGRDRLVVDRVNEIRRAIEDAKARAVTLADLGATPPPPFGSRPGSADGPTGAAEQPAIDLVGLERVLLSTGATAKFFQPHPAIPGAYLVEPSISVRPVTFRRSVLEGYAPDVLLLTYGSEEIERLLAATGLAKAWLQPGAGQEGPSLVGGVSLAWEVVDGRVVPVFRAGERVMSMLLDFEAR
jgi:hypothetical protein